MAGSIKGIIVEIGGDTSKLQDALKKVNSVTSSLSKELRGINSLLKLDPTNTELLSQKQTVLSKSIENTQNKLTELKKIKEEADKKMSEGTQINEENYRYLQREIVNTQNKLADLKNEASNWNKVGNYFTNIGNELDQISTKVNNLGNKLTKNLTIPVAGALAYATKEAIEFESAFTGVEKTVDGTAEQMEELKQGIKNMAKEIPSSTTEISKVAEAAGQLGIKTDDILDFTKVMIDLGNSTNLSAETAATSLAKFANITNMSAKDYDRLGATIVDLGNNFATTEADIVSMATRLAATGELAGLSESDILSLATAMSSVGIEAEAGGSAMSKLLKKIQVATETGNNDLKQFAKVAGMTSKEFKKAFEKNAVGALASFIDGLNDTKRNGKSAIAILDDMGLTEIRLSNTVLSLANASGLMTKAVETGANAWKENTALTNEANKRYATVESQLAITKNKINDVSMSLGEKMLPAVNNILEKVDKWVNKLDNLSDAEKENIVQIGLMVVAAGPLLKIGSSAISILGSVSSGIGTFTKAISLAHNGIGTTTGSAANLAKAFQALTSPVGLAALGITAAVTAIVVAIENAEQATRTAFTNIGTGATEFVLGIQTAQSYLQAFNTELFVSAEEQQQLQEQMSEVQRGITDICRTATEERRNYTQEEILQLDTYFERLRQLNQREIEIQQQISAAITQQAVTNAQNLQGSLEEYKQQSQQWLKTAEEQKEKTIELIEKQTIEEVALLNTRYSTEADRQTEEYEKEYQKIIAQKDEKIAEANDEVAKINQVYANGYLERSRQNDGFYNDLKTYISKQENLEKSHLDKVQKLKNQQVIGATNTYQAINAENYLYSENQKKIWNQMYENMSTEQEKELGIWLAMVQQTELYGGEIDDETKELVDSILASYESMPPETRKTMKNAMTPMLQEMQKMEPVLYAKAQSIADGIAARLRAAFDEHSPSKVTREIFQNVMKGAELGLEDEREKLNKQVDTIANQVRENFNNMVPNMGAIKESVIDKTRTVFTTPNMNFYVQKMDEDNLNTAFNYVNRRLGSQY